MNKRSLTIVIVILFLAAFSVALHQWVYWGVWFEMDDIHHETFTIALVFAGLLVWFIKTDGKAPNRGCFGF